MIRKPVPFIPPSSGGCSHHNLNHEETGLKKKKKRKHVSVQRVRWERVTWKFLSISTWSLAIQGQSSMKGQWRTVISYFLFPLSMRDMRVQALMRDSSSKTERKSGCRKPGNFHQNIY